MDWTTIGSALGLLLASGVVSSLVTAWFSKMAADKKARIENVTKERKVWRDKIRKLTKVACKAFEDQDKKKLRAIKTDLMVRLNPGDAQDRAIIKSLEDLSTAWSAEKLNEFNVRMAALLKHDWERVKIEASRTVATHSLGIALIAVILTAALIVMTVKNTWLAQKLPIYFAVIGLTPIAIFLVAYWCNSQVNTRFKQKQNNEREKMVNEALADFRERTKGPRN